MCGIVGGIAERNVSPILLEGLRRLEYRGYDSAGIAVVNPESKSIQRLRTEGKVASLAEAVKANPLPGLLGIAHTRWATHGSPSEKNAHPHVSDPNLAIVHNGIIENHETLRAELVEAGYHFTSDTDTEVMAHLLHYKMQHTDNFLDALHEVIQQLEGAYGVGIINAGEPDTLYAVRSGSPLVIGIGIGENFIASDPLALMPVTQQFIYLEEGDTACLTKDSVKIFNRQGKPVERKIHVSDIQTDQVSKGEFRHYMLKEIFEQPQVAINALEGRITQKTLIDQAFGVDATSIFPTIQRVTIVACGTSYHAGLVAKYWIEKFAGLPCQVEIASENRYRSTVVEPNSLFVALSQSGETADTLAALRKAKEQGLAATLAICNVSASSLVRESDLAFMVRAGTEIGVAATKSFTAQLIALLMLTLTLMKHHRPQSPDYALIIDALQQLPHLLNTILELDSTIIQVAQDFQDSHHALFLGRDIQYPIAMEGALKLKEISYIHAEAYAAGELKHGPLALVDEHMPIIVIAPKDELTSKLQSNIMEVQARGGRLYIFSDETLKWTDKKQTTIIKLPTIPAALAPILYNIPLQLLSYHIAVVKGTDVDQPRNLAKSVTVE